MSIKEQLILEIEQAPEESLIKFMELWQLAKKASIHPDNYPTKLSEFFHQSPLAKVVATDELDLSRDRSLAVDRFIV